jgi:hypothetical protein
MHIVLPTLVVKGARKMRRPARFWGWWHQLASPPTIESRQTNEAYPEGGRLGRLELVFLHTARAGAAPLRRFLEKYYSAALRTEYNTQPPQHRFEPVEMRYWIDWVSRMIPNTGRAFATNFLVQPHDVGYSIRPVKFITLVREPIARIAGEFVAFRRQIEARGGADAETQEIASDIVRFADAMMRNDYLVRFFSTMDVCDPIEGKHFDHARAALARLDVVGRHENPQPFAQRLLSLDVFADEGYSDARVAFAAEMSQAFRGPGDELASQLDPQTRQQLERRNSYDLMLYRWIASEL